MYVLRLISAVLHVKPGPAVRDEALDLRPGELALVLPLVACLLALSAWPALVSESSFPSDRACCARSRRIAVIDTPNVDWLALSPTLALLGASGVALLAAVLVPRLDAANRLRGRRVRRLRRRGRVRGRPLRPEPDAERAARGVDDPRRARRRSRS